MVDSLLTQDRGSSRFPIRLSKPGTSVPTAELHGAEHRDSVLGTRPPIPSAELLLADWDFPVGLPCGQ